MQQWVSYDAKCYFFTICRVKDSQAFSVAQEEKNVRAKEAFGIADDFIPGQSIKDKINMPKEAKVSKIQL